MTQANLSPSASAAVADQPLAAWGAPPSERYEELAAPLRPLFARIRESAVERDLEHRLPHEEITWLREAGFTRLRLPREQGGADATLPELFGLLIELGAADTNVVNAVRAHLGFVEDVLTAREQEWRAHWLAVLADGALIGAGLSEAGAAKVGTFATELTHTPQGLRLNGRKFYTTGSLFADWIAVAAQHGEETVYLQVPRQAPGVKVLDDWDGFGQALTASGTAVFEDVTVKPDWVRPTAARFPYAVPFYQLVHLASLAGIGRALADDVARRVQQRDRVYSHGNAARVADDPQILQVVGRVHGAAYAAGATSLQAAKALQRSYETHLDPQANDAQRDKANAEAHVEVDQSVS
ncbi:MAG TPA: acyl-CoA dehydrogenase family protein, partial [Paraburkholderia sp.]|nr:acyl-CoA dehydrogenase family protein [Paraburkholderia sp.]